MALLVVALTVTANKLNKLRAEKAHIDTPRLYNQTNWAIYDEVGEGTAPTGGLQGHYQGLELAKMEGSQYASLGKKKTSAKS